MAQYNELETITRMIEGLERRLKSLETSGRLFASGIGQGGINVHDKGSIRVEDGGEVNIYDGGNLEVYGTSTKNGAIAVGTGGKVVADGPVSFSKSSTFGGNVTITGDLTVTGDVSIKSGLIKSNALKNQMSSSTTTKKASGFSISTSYSTKVSASLTAPSWATKAVVYASGSVEYTGNPVNPDTQLGRADTRISIDGSYSLGTIIHPAGVSDNSFGASLGLTEVVSNPGTITSTIQVGDREANHAVSSNSAVINVLAVFYR